MTFLTNGVDDVFKAFHFFQVAIEKLKKGKVSDHLIPIDVMNMQPNVLEEAIQSINRDIDQTEKK